MVRYTQLSCIGMKPMGSAEKKSRSSALSPKRKSVSAHEGGMHYVVCIRNEDFPASLEIRKIYQSIPDPASKKLNLIRVIDESGEDYLYPHDYFIAVKLPRAVERAVQLAS